MLIVFVSILVIASSTMSFATTALDWLANQQNPTTNLLDSYEGDNSNVAYNYEQALAIMAFTSNNDLVRARKILDKMVAIQNGEF